MSKHLMKTYAEGEKDEHRLTVHGLSYLRKLDQEIELRRAILAFAARIASILVGSFFGCSVFLCSPAVGIIGSTCVGIVEPFCMGCVLIGPVGVGLLWAS
jgi:hypothetical protein